MYDNNKKGVLFIINKIINYLVNKIIQKIINKK